MSGRAGPIRVALASDLTLVAEAVATALSSRGYEVFGVRWPAAPRDDPASRQLARITPHVAILVYDLDLSIRMAEASALIRGSPGCWLVLSGLGPDGTWGGILEAGATHIVSNLIGLDDLTIAVQDLARGRTPMPRSRRAAVVGQWRRIQRDSAEVQQRVDTLTPRERQVLAMLHEGTTVREIAGLLELSEATVRSQVKAVLRKLSVRTQLAAVAAVGNLYDGPSGRKRR